MVPSITPGSPSMNAWPARPRHASLRHNLPPILLRALKSVPSGAVVRAILPLPRPSAFDASVFVLKTDSNLVRGPSRTRYSSNSC